MDHGVRAATTIQHERPPRPILVRRGLQAFHFAQCLTVPDWLAGYIFPLRNVNAPHAFLPCALTSRFHHGRLGLLRGEHAHDLGLSALTLLPTLLHRPAVASNPHAGDGVIGPRAALRCARSIAAGRKSRGLVCKNNLFRVCDGATPRALLPTPYATLKVCMSEMVKLVVLMMMLMMHEVMQDG